ncbi:hypothetical protein AAVH_31256 [Aphelenchoides avenae]|nr:hypothetical protein AAVH_31256 [Aphelenchus avenae]
MPCFHFWKLQSSMQCTNCKTFEHTTIYMDEFGCRNAKDMLQTFEKLLRTSNTVSRPDGKAKLSIALRKKCTP